MKRLLKKVTELLIEKPETTRKDIVQILKISEQAAKYQLEELKKRAKSSIKDR